MTDAPADAKEKLRKLLSDVRFVRELENALELSNGVLWDYFTESLGYVSFFAGVDDLQQNASRYAGLWSPPAGYDTVLRTTKYADQYFKEHGVEFVKQLTRTDREKLKRLLEKYWGVGEDVFAREIKNEYLFSSERAKRIYRTETHMAHEAGAYMFARGGGAKYKMWLGNQQNACGICSRLHGEIQPVDRPFSHGTMFAHAHPRCRCTTLYFVEKP